MTAISAENIRLPQKRANFFDIVNLALDSIQQRIESAVATSVTTENCQPHLSQLRLRRLTKTHHLQDKIKESRIRIY